MHNLIKNNLYPIIDEYCDNKKKYYVRSDLQHLMFSFLFVSMFGKKVILPTKTDIQYKKFMKYHHLYWSIYIKRFMFATVGENSFITKMFGSNVMLTHKTCLSELYNLFSHFLDEYKRNALKKNTKNTYEKDDCYIDRVIKCVNLEQIEEKEMISDATLLLTIGMHATLSEMETVLYYAAKNPLQQDMVYNELNDYYKNKNNDIVFL